MSTQSEQENLNEFTQQLNSVTNTVSHSEHSDYNWMFNLLVTPPDTNDIPQEALLMKLSDDDNKLLGSGLEPGSNASLTIDMNQNWESYRTPMSSSSLGYEFPQPFNSHVEDGAWCFEQELPDSSYMDHSGQASRLKPEGKASSQIEKAGGKGWKRKGQLKEEQQAERRKKKREADKKYRADLKMELDKLRRMKQQYDKLMVIVSRFGGISQMVSYINHSIRINSELLRLQQKEMDEMNNVQESETMSQTPELMKSKYGGIEEMGSILLDKLKDMVDETHKLNQLKSNMGIQEAETVLEKYKEMEAQLQSLKQKLENQAELESFPFPSSPGSRQQKEMYASEVEDFDRFEYMKSKFGDIDKMEFMLEKFHEMEAQLNSLKEREEQRQQEPPSLQVSVSETSPNLHYSDVLVDQLIQSLNDDNVASNSDDLGSFEELLDGDRQMVGKYKIPTPLVSTAQNIFNVHGDITKKSKYSVYVVQNIFVLFCAAIKEMGDRSLEQVTEEIIWKLRDPIMDAKRSDFDVEFAMKYLMTIVQGHFGLRARKDHISLEQTITCLRVDEEALRRELEKKSQEIKSTEAKQRDLTSDKCKLCLESANKFLCKTVSIF